MGRRSTAGLFVPGAYLGNCLCPMFSAIFAQSASLTSVINCLGFCPLLQRLSSSLVFKRNHIFSSTFFSLLSDTKMPTLPSEPEAAPEAVSSQPPQSEPRIVVASRAGRLLRSVRLLLAREKSYDVSTAEGRRRGRRPAKSVSSTR